MLKPIMTIFVPLPAIVRGEGGSPWRLRGSSVRSAASISGSRITRPSRRPVSRPAGTCMRQATRSSGGSKPTRTMWTRSCPKSPGASPSKPSASMPRACSISTPGPTSTGRTRPSGTTSTSNASLMMSWPGPPGGGPSPRARKSPTCSLAAGPRTRGPSPKWMRCSGRPTSCPPAMLPVVRTCPTWGTNPTR